jgi:predicted Fe-Mo cluster-binding NifX family protein
MKIAVSATGKNVYADVDPRFGRARYLLIVDDKGTMCDLWDNSASQNAMQGAGIQAAKVLADKGVQVLLTGHCGPNAFRTLRAAGIKVGLVQSGTVRQAVERFQRNEVSFTDQPDVEAQW